MKLLSVSLPLCLSASRPLCFFVSVSPIWFPLSGSPSGSVWFAFLRDHDGHRSALPSSPAHGSTHRTETQVTCFSPVLFFLCCARHRCLLLFSVFTLDTPNQTLEPFYSALSLTLLRLSPIALSSRPAFAGASSTIFLLINTELCSPSPTSHHDTGQIVPCTCLHLLARLRFRVQSFVIRGTTPDSSSEATCRCPTQRLTTHAGTTTCTDCAPRCCTHQLLHNSATVKWRSSSVCDPLDSRFSHYPHRLCPRLVRLTLFTILLAIHLPKLRCAVLLAETHQQECFQSYTIGAPPNSNFDSSGSKLSFGISVTSSSSMSFVFGSALTSCHV